MYYYLLENESQICFLIGARQGSYSFRDGVTCQRKSSKRLYDKLPVSVA